MRSEKSISGSGEHNKIVLGILAFLISGMVWLSLSLSEQYYTTINVPIKITNLPVGYSFDGEFPEKLIVKMKMQGWKLLFVRNLQEEAFVVQAPKDFVNGKINFKSAISENPWLSGEGEIISISPEDAQIHVARSFSKKVKVCASLQLGFEDGFGLARPVEMDPDSITISGTKATLDKIDSVVTEMQKYTGLEKGISVQLALTKQQGITYSEEQVMVTLVVQKILDKDFTGVHVEAINLPPDRSVAFTPEEITVNARGGLDILGKLQSKDFRAYVDYKEILDDSLGVITPNVILPPFVEKNYLEPTKIRVVIKKL